MPLMPQSGPLEERFRGNSEVLLTEVGDGTGVLLDLGTKFYFTLNVTGVVLWQALIEGGAEGMTGAALANRMSDRFAVDTVTAERDLAPVLTEMLSEGLVGRGR
jgi:hypothetical protein